MDGKDEEYVLSESQENKQKSCVPHFIEYNSMNSVKCKLCGKIYNCIECTHIGSYSIRALSFSRSDMVLCTETCFLCKNIVEFWACSECHKPYCSC